MISKYEIQRQTIFCINFGSVVTSIVDIYRRIEGPQFLEINADESMAEVESRVFEKLEMFFPALRQ